MDSTEPASKRFRKTPFQSKHLLQNGISIANRDTRFFEVVALRCQFCVYFGREEHAKTP